MALNHTNSTTTKTSMYSKLALGAASFVVLAAVGSTTIAGATSLEGQAKETNSSHAQSEQGKDRGQSQNHPGTNNGKGHGYGGGNGNEINSGLTVNQDGHDNVLTVIINYIFG